MTRRLPPPLVALSPGTLAPGGALPLLRGLERALAAGLPGVLLREPLLDERAFADLLAATRVLTTERGAWLGVHDRAHHAALAARGPDGPAVHGLHLGFRSLPPAAARTLVGEAVALGLSTHAHDDAEAWRGADYLFHGPVRATPSKDGLLEPLGDQGLRAGVARAADVGVPDVWALGGLEPRDAAAVRAAGARGLVVLRGVLGADDPGRAAAAYLAAWEAAA